MRTAIGRFHCLSWKPSYRYRQPSYVLLAQTLKTIKEMKTAIELENFLSFLLLELLTANISAKHKPPARLRLAKGLISSKVSTTEQM